MKAAKAKKAAKEEKVKQLDLGIKEPLKNKFFKIKGKTDKALMRLEVRKFLRDAFFWFITCTNLVMFVQQIYLFYMKIALLPKYIPLLSYNLEAESKLIEKDYILIFPAISLLCLIFSIIFTSKYYNNEKVLTKYLMLCSVLVTIACSILLVHITEGY